MSNRFINYNIFDCNNCNINDIQYKKDINKLLYKSYIENNINTTCKKEKTINPIKFKENQYDYFLNTYWFNYCTTDGWGATKNNGTYDSYNGYGVTDFKKKCNKIPNNLYRNSLPNGKKLKTVYIYEGKKYLNPYSLVKINNEFKEVYKIPNVKRICEIINV